MKTTFQNKRICAMLGVLPEQDVNFDDEVDNYSFPPRQTMRLKKMMGFNKHCIAKDATTVSDFGVYGLTYMLDNGWIRKEEIGALVVVTLCPDHFVPHVSNIIQGKCDLSSDTICLDIAQGCNGFLVGLMESCMLLEHMEEGKKAVLINGDVLSHRASKRDRNEYPIVGDAAAITVFENGGGQEIYYEMHMDGSRGDFIKIPAGAFRMPSSPETAIQVDAGDGNFRSLDDINMNGYEVFNFAQTEVPPMMERALKETGKSLTDFDYFLFHQPNKFMLRKLAEKIGLPMDKTPLNLVETYGNTNGATIPMTAILNLKESLLDQSYYCCLTSFGSGLAFGTAFMHIGNLNHCDMIRSDL